MQLKKLPFALCLVASFTACVVDDGGDSDTDAATTTDPSTTMTTDPSTTMTTDPSTTMTTDPSTDPSSSTDPATTDPGTDTVTDTDVSTSGVDSSGTETGTETGVIGDCGWDEANMFYACGGVGEDPEGNFPLECGEEPVAGAECDENSVINGIGCCFAGGNAFCGKDGTIQIDDSCAAG
jgi:hypothetical protein